MVHHVLTAGRLHLYTVMQPSFTPACILFDFSVLIYSIIAYLAYIYAVLGLFLYVYAINIRFIYSFVWKNRTLSKCAGFVQTFAQTIL